MSIKAGAGVSMSLLILAIVGGVAVAWYKSSH